MPQYLVIQLARFGDLVQTKRLLRTLEARGSVHLCIDPSLTGVAELLSPGVQIHPLPVHGRPCRESLEMVRRTCAALASLSFEAVYNLNHAGFNRVLARLFAPEQVRGYSMHGPQVLRSAWVRRAFRWTRQRVLAPLNLVDFWACFDKRPCPPEEVNPVAKGQGGGIGVVLAGRESRRSLPPPLLARCVHTTFEALGGVPVTLLGSTAEKPLARQLLRQLPGHMLDRVQDLSGKTQWKQLADALTGLDVVLSPDTGTMHLAAHLGVPVQAFFLSSAWCHETGPYGQGHTVWQSVYECAPCLEAAPCALNTVCGRDFAGSALIRGLALQMGSGQGQRLVRTSPGTAAALEADAALCPHKDWPPHLLCATSRLDGLGSTWQTEQGHDPHAVRRTALRCLVAEAVGAPGPRACSPEVQSLLTDPALLELVYDEGDWALPECPPQKPLLAGVHP